MKNSPLKNGFAALCTLAAFALLLAPGFAKEHDDAIPADVDRILKNMAGYLESVDQFTFQADILFDEVLDSYQSVQHGSTVKAAVHRPNKLAAKIESDLNARTMWYDGKTVTMYNEERGIVAQTKGANTIGKTLDQLMEKFNVSMPLADFVSEDIYKNLVAHIDTAFLVGKATVNGRRCDHIACTQELIDWQLWVEDGIRRLPRKVVITYKTIPGEPQYMAELSHWDLDARLPALLFNATPPADAVKIDMLDTSALEN